MSVSGVFVCTLHVGALMLSLTWWL